MSADNPRTEVDLATRIEERIDKEQLGGIGLAGGNGALSLVPKDMNDLLEFSKAMALAGTALRKDFRNKPGTCLALTLQALRWGMDPFAVASKAYVVNDQVAMEGQLVHAVVNTRAPLQKRLRPTYTGKDETRQCTVSGLLIGETEVSDYTSPEKGKIKPQNSPLWKNDPDQQLFYFSVRSWARRWVPEVLMGVYTDEELSVPQTPAGPDDARDITPARPVRQQKVEPEKTEPDFDFDFVDKFGVIDETYHTPESYLSRVKVEIETCKEHGQITAVFEHNNDVLSEACKVATDREVLQLYGPIERAYEKAQKAGIASDEARQRARDSAKEADEPIAPPEDEEAPPAEEGDYGTAAEEEQGGAVEPEPEREEKDWFISVPQMASGGGNWMGYYGLLIEQADNAQSDQDIDDILQQNSTGLVEMRSKSKTTHGQLIKAIEGKKGNY